MLSIIPELTKMSFCGLAIGIMRGFRSHESSEPKTFPVDHNIGTEAAGALISPNSLEASFAIRANLFVLSILLARRGTQVCPFVASEHASLVVNLRRFGSPGHLPNNAMGVEDATSHTDRGVAESISSGRGKSISKSAIRLGTPSVGGEMRTWSRLPAQFTAFWVVREALAEIVRLWQYLMSHFVLRHGRWSGAASPASQGRRFEYTEDRAEHRPMCHLSYAGA